MKFRNIVNVLICLAGIVLVLLAMLHLRVGRSQDMLTFIGGSIIFYIFYKLDECLADCIREVGDQDGNGL